MHATAMRVQSLLHAQAIDTQVIESSQPTRTASDAAVAIGASVGQICKSIVFERAGEAVMVIASGANQIDIEKVERVVGGPLRKAQAAFVREKTGFAIGGVAPIGLAEPAVIVLDEALMGYDVVYAAAGTPNSLFGIKPTELVRITGGRVIDCRQEVSG
ncbi:MAG: YbaK/EbsC family protein [Herpetosiphon sp.]